MASRSEVAGIPLYVGNGHSGKNSVAAGYDLWARSLRKTVLAAAPLLPWLQHTRPPTHSMCSRAVGTLQVGLGHSTALLTVPRLPAAPGLKSKLPMRVHLSTCPAAHLAVKLEAV